MSIQDELEKIEERQRKAVGGKWYTMEPAFAPGIGKRQFTTIKGPKVLPSGYYGKPRFVNAEDAEYIAAACCPETGDVTRLLRAVGVLAEALEKCQEADDGAVRFLKGFAATADTVDERSIARVALAAAEAELSASQNDQPNRKDTP